jgi:hypothetical protein
MHTNQKKTPYYENKYYVLPQQPKLNLTIQQPKPQTKTHKTPNPITPNHPQHTTNTKQDQQGHHFHRKQRGKS